MWNDILQPFNKCSINLQSSHIDISTAVGLLKSLETVNQTIRDYFDVYEQRESLKHTTKTTKLLHLVRERKNMMMAVAHQQI